MLLSFYTLCGSWESIGEASPFRILNSSQRHSYAECHLWYIYVLLQNNNKKSGSDSHAEFSSCSKRATAVSLPILSGCEILVQVFGVRYRSWSLLLCGSVWTWIIAKNLLGNCWLRELIFFSPQTKYQYKRVHKAESIRSCLLYLRVKKKYIHMAVGD